VTGELGGSVTVNRVGPNLDQGLPWQRKGRVSTLVPLTDKLIAGIDVGASAASNQVGTVLAYTGLVQGQGWHYIASGEKWTGRTLCAVFTPELESESRLWFSDGDTIRYCILADTSENPRETGIDEFAPAGMLQLPKFYAGLRDLNKDWRSVQVETEDIDQGTIEIWYKTEDTDWLTLGTIESGTASEIAFPSNTYSHWIQLGFLLTRQNVKDTPALKVHALHYMPVLPPRELFTVRLNLHEAMTDNFGQPGYQSVTDAKQLIEDLKARVEPFTFIDPFSDVWDVKITRCIFQEVAKRAGTTESPDYELVADVTLLQVTEQDTGLMVTQ
jgi:hypothetical protein